MTKNISSKVKYDFNQILTALEAFTVNIELKLQEIKEDLPVFILETGDETYYLEKKFVKSENKDIYQKVPRFVIKLLDIQFTSDENTNLYNRYYFKKDDKVYTATGRRLAINIPIETNFVSSNFIKMLENFEIMATIIAKPNVFTYEFMGNTFEAAYSHSANSNENPALDATSASTNSVIKTQFDLQVHLLVPRIESIKEISETEFDIIRYNLNQNKDNNNLDYQGNLDIDLTSNNEN